ncbi:MAG: Ger(x)C family spore germination protein [Ruminiclostridium sp.]
MGKRIKTICLFLCIVLCAVIFSGCYDNSEIEDLAYVMAIGIDEAESNSFLLTFQTAVPKSIAGGGSSGGGGGESTDVTSFKTDNFLSGIKKANEYLSRSINLSHTKIIVVSENIATKGVTAFLSGLQQNMEIRPDVNIIVASEGAKKYIESIQPKLTSNPAKYYDLLFSTYETDFLVPSTQLENYMERAKNYGAQSVAIYTETDKAINESSKPSDGEEGVKKSEGEGKKAGNGEKKNMAIKGLAVFQMDRMVGKLNPEEATIFALLTGSNNSVIIEVTDPLDKRFKVLSSVMKEKSSSTKVKFNNNKPIINITLKINIDVQAVQSDINYDEPDKAAKLEMSYKDYLNKGIKSLLEKTTRDFKSDIFGYGELAKQNFRTINEWEKAKWTEIFPQSEYNYKIDLKVTRQG